MRVTGFHELHGGVSIIECRRLVSSLFSLFFFNLNDDWDRWALYFFPYFYLGVIIQRSLTDRGGQSQNSVLSTNVGR